MSDKPSQAEPMRTFPWRGFYGGKVRNINIEYDDMSSTHLGLDNCASLENAHTELRQALSDALDWIMAERQQDAAGPLTPHGEAELARMRKALSDAEQSSCSTPADDAQNSASGEK